MYNACNELLLLSSSTQTSTVGDSTVRLLLGVDVIQSPLMTVLLDKLAEFQGGEDDFIFHQGQKIYVPRLLLSQFRFLDRIVDGKELSKKLLEILNITSVGVQKEIMACIPDIVEDTEHGDVAKKLRDELRSNTELTCSVIDALTYLNISADLVTEMRNSVVEMLKSFSIHDLPIVVNFLLESVSPQEALEVVNEIRSNVDFTTSSRLTATEIEKVKTSIKLTVDALKGRMQFHRFVAEAWIKALDVAKDFKIIDIFILLMLHWMNHKKAVESLVRNKIRAGILTEELVNNVFTSYTQVIREYFPSVLSLAQALIRSAEPVICCVGMHNLQTSFHEIIGNLVTHIGSGFAGEIEASLDILTELVTHQLQAVSQFAIFVKGVLDYLDHNNLTVAQIRKLYLLLAQLAFHDTHSGHYLQDDLHIIVRKQLTSGNPRYKRMGVMGAVSIVHAISSRSEEDSDTLSTEDYNQVISLLELVQSNGRRDPETAALFIDSLGTMMKTQKLSGKVEAWIATNMTDVFELNFVADIIADAHLKENTLLPIDALFGLNNESESTIAINLVPLAEKQLNNKVSQQKDSSENNLACLAPLFHLVTICELRQSEENLENIDALLGCPVLMVRPSVYAKFEPLSPAEKDLACASLFFCINWFREVVNSFAPMSDPEMKAKVLMRLKHITELGALLRKCLSTHRNFQPPTAIFDCEAVPAKAITAGPSTSGKEVKKKGKKAGAKKKEKENSVDGEEAPSTLIIESITQADVSVQSQNVASKSEEAAMDLSNYRQYFRELDIKVFTILKTGLIKKAALDSQMNTKTKEELQIGLPELQFLLEDLSLKLSHSLIASAYKRRTFLKAKTDKKVGFTLLDLYTPAEIAAYAVDLLPCLCDHLETACCRFSQESLTMTACFQLLLQCILSLLSWNGFTSEEHRPLLRNALKAVVIRLSVSKDQNSFISHEDSLAQSFQYFGNLVETVPNLDTAVTLLKLLMVLAENCHQTALKGQLATHAKSFLSRDWRCPNGEHMKGAKHCENLQAVIKIFLENSPEPLEALENVASKGLATLMNQEKNARSEEFGSLNRLTFAVYYKVVMAELINNIKRIPAGKKSESEDVREERLLSWGMAIKVLHVTIMLTKMFTARSNLGTALKYGRQFVDIFLRQGMPLFDVTFRRHHAVVERLLRSLQQSTRVLHHLCGHSKITKDMALTNQVPPLKRALEAFVYRVKAMLTLNNCQDAFWVGNLKNRNLQGEEILTQTSTTSSNNTTAAVVEDGNIGDNDDDEQNASGIEDDDDSEVEMDQEGDQTGAGDSKADGDSYSEVF
ncbi:unnamed protein product [Candidula unifasciata]|uniref:Fanconi anemia group D2 protein n=1 Tax=Candidula unifasciata TaxID=100452 RepID=A0A8S3Z7C5_9EUPU|nr:unnamed protein product [Candidula unifasciata]